MLVPPELGAGAGLPETGVGVEALTSPAELGAGAWVVLHATRPSAATDAATQRAERAVILSSCLQAATARRGAARRGRRRGCCWGGCGWGGAGFRRRGRRSRAGAGRRLGASADRAVRSELFLDILLELRRNAVRRAPAAL